MDHAKKMLLIDPEVMEKFKNNTCHTKTDSLSQLDDEMNKVLKTKLDDREKWSLYLQTLQRYLYFINKDRKPLQIPLISFDDSENNIKENVNSNTAIDSKDEFVKTHVKSVNETIKEENKDYFVKSQLLQLIPKTYKLKGELLIDLLLKNKDKIYWNERGTVFINNKEINKSNIVDLLNDVIRPLKNSSPHGWVEFNTILKDLHVPLSYIGNPKRTTYINVLSKTPEFGKRFETSADSSKSSEFTTPQSHQKGNKDQLKRKINWERWTPY